MKGGGGGREAGELGACGLMLLRVVGGGGAQWFTRPSRPPYISRGRGWWQEIAVTMAC